MQHVAEAGELLTTEEAEVLAEAMAAFSTPSRLKLLYALAAREWTVEDLAAATGLAPTLVSQQLRVLRLLRLVAGSREGRHIRYRLYDKHIVSLLTAVRDHGEHVRLGLAAAPSHVGRAKTGSDSKAFIEV